MRRYDDMRKLCRGLVLTLTLAGTSLAQDQYTHTNLGAIPDAYITSAVRMNNLGQVVGGSLTSEQGFHAFVWSDGQMIDLNDRSAGAPVLLTTAVDITDSGFILCLTGQDLYLLTPDGN